MYFKQRFVLVFAIAIIVSSHAFAGEGDVRNFRFTPGGALIGVPTIFMDWKLGENWTIGPAFNFVHTFWDGKDENLNPVEVRVTGGGLGFQGNYYFSGAMNSSWFVGALAETYGLEFEVINGSLNGKADKVQATKGQLFAGYHWFWNTFNFAIFGGGQSRKLDKDVTVTYNNGTTAIIDAKDAGTKTRGFLETTVGWTY
jgi:hypothetical protein